MSIAKSLQGAKSRAVGIVFEKRIDAACEDYAARGIARIEKTPEPMRVLRNLGNGQYVACFTKTAQPDYKGVLKGGRSVCFEAKFTETDRMDQKRVTKEQTEALNAHAKLGAVCFVVCGFADNSAYCVPWSVWTNMKALFGRLYVTQEDIAEYAVRGDLRVWFLDHIGEVQKHG